MRVYLDNNILVNVENNSLEIDSFIKNPLVDYYYSETHIDELINGLEKHPELKETRLQTLGLICGTNYIEPDVGPFKARITEMTPQCAFDLSMRFKFSHDQLYELSNSMHINRDEFLRGVNMKKTVIGNYKPSEIFGILENKLNEYWGYGIDLYLKKSLSTTGRTVFSSLFNLLDFFCYWHDDDSAARFYDSSHAYFAQFCDVLVSDDRRMKIKTEAVYWYLDIKTKVCSADDYLTMLANA